jgi:hypothetical protein
MFKGVFDNLPYLSSEVLKKKREGNLGERFDHLCNCCGRFGALCAYGFSVFIFLVITTLKDEFLSVNNCKQCAFKTSNMCSCYKLQHKNTLRSWNIFHMQSPHDHVNYVMIMDLLID